MGAQKKSQGGPGGEKQKLGKKGQAEAGPAAGEAPTCCGCRFPLLVALLQLLLGIAITAVAFLMGAISPSLLTRETPHWAGIAVCVVSLLGFLLYCITYLPDERNTLQFAAKLLYFILCALGVFISGLVIAFESHHHVQVSSYACEEEGENCVCTPSPNEAIRRTVIYEEVTDCSAISSTLQLYYLLQILLNLGQAIVCFVGAYIMWKHRYQVFFVGMQVGCPSTQQWQKV
ncbi:sarcospan [Denticeps clupeoides]|uniref:Sarcospan n=1 Tax=Denticeps clupeoides TaxID=299321 RepID=A0AAY4DN26_9TELE|nr:sarcospan [Denticeps clupeoides]